MKKIYKGVLNFDNGFSDKPVNEFLGYSCRLCGEFYGFDEYAAMNCCGENNYCCRYKRLSDNKIFDI